MLENFPRLYTYTMSTDCGIAPNPFWNNLTLTLCKRFIRKNCIKGDWIAGFAGGAIEKKTEFNGKKLIFLMQVKNKIEMEVYSGCSKFQNKIVDITNIDPFRRIGDSVLDFKNGDCECLPHHHYGDEVDKRDELKGVYALVAEIFYYFGRQRLEIEDENAHVKVIGRGHLNPDKQNPTTVKNFLAYVKREHANMLKTIPQENYSKYHNVPLPDYWYNGNGTGGRSKNGNYQGS